MWKVLIVVAALIAVGVQAQDRQLIDPGAVVVMVTQRQDPVIEIQGRPGVCGRDGRNVVLRNRERNESVTVTVRV